MTRYSKKRVWEVLRTPPKSPRQHLEDDLLKAITEEITREMDAEILAELRKLVDNDNR